MEVHVSQEIVRSYECGPEGLLKPGALLHWIQEIAEEHAEHLGFGYDFCRTSGCAWVEIALAARITRWPQWKEKAHVQTWTFASSPLVATRDFRIRDDQGNIIMEVSTQWVLISMEKRRPVPLKRIIAHIPEDKADSLLPLLENSACEKKGEEMVYSFPAEFHNVDFNGHINNAAYLNWALDSIADKKPSWKKLNGMSIRFLKETMPGMKMESWVGWNSDSRSIHRLVSEEKERALLILEWEK